MVSIYRPVYGGRNYDYFDGDIAMIAYWERALTAAGAWVQMFIQNVIP